MAKVLLTNTYFYKLDPKQWKMKQPYPPLGTLWAASVLRDSGHIVKVYDTNLTNTPDEIIPVIRKHQPDYLVIYDDGFNYLTKMCLTVMREAAFSLSKYGKEMGCKVIVSSSDSSDHYEKYLNQGADFIIIGEGELTLEELLSGKVDPDEIEGLAFRKNGETILTGKRKVIRELDSLPDPAWDLIDLNPYKDLWINNHGFFSLNMATTRGCPFKCNWCAKPIYGNRYNSRSPGRVADEIDYLVKNYDVDHFWMCDDIFGLKPGWVQNFRDIIKQKELKFKYKIQSRVDLLLKEDTIDALAESGLETAWVGAESGSQKILDAMDKGTKIEQVYEATNLLKAKGVKVAFFLQFGYLGETKEDIRKTIDMVLDLLPNEIGISVSYPLPGTKFYEKVKNDLNTKANWTDSDDLDMMFAGTYQPAYYKRLHRYVHKIYRTKVGFKHLNDMVKNPSSLNKSKLKKALAAFYYIPAAQIDKLKLNKLAVPH